MRYHVRSVAALAVGVMLLSACGNTSSGTSDQPVSGGTLFELHRELLEQGAALVHDCPCLAGCPSCIGPLHLVEGAKEACLKLLSGTALPV